MDFREWIAENIGYRFCGCFYNKTHDSTFNSIIPLIPKEFFNREISDLGCGDGGNTFRIQKIFKAKKITDYERNEFLITRAKKRGLNVKKFDLNNEVPKGEMATITFALHHLHNKEEILNKIKTNFKYLFLIEPTLDLYHYLFDVYRPPKKEKWIEMLDNTLGKYELHRVKNHIVIFYRKTYFRCQFSLHSSSVRNQLFRRQKNCI